MKKVLPNTAKTTKFLDSLPNIYLVACWADYGVRPYKFSGKYEKTVNGCDIPLVWDYDDHNGITDNWYLRRIDRVTTGSIITWTFFRETAYNIAKAFVYKEKWFWKNGMVEN